MKTVNSIKDFNEIVSGDKPVFLDFYADWCGPCKALMPTVEKVAEEYKGKAVVAKINVDNNRELASHFGVKSIPTLLFIKDKKLVNRYQGMQSKTTLQSQLEKML